MLETNKTKKTRKVKSKRIKTETMGSILKVYTSKGWEHMFYLRSEDGWFRISRITFHSQERGGVDLILSRRECSRMLLSLQHQFGGKSVRIRYKTRKRKSRRTV